MSCIRFREDRPRLDRRGPIELHDGSLIAMTEPTSAQDSGPFDFYAAQIRVLHDLDLAAEDLAVVYSPNWDPQG